MSDRPRIAIIGAGGHGRVLLDAVLAAGCYQVVGFVDDDPAKAGQHVFGVPVLGATADIAVLAREFRFPNVALAIGDNYLRHEKLLLARAAGLSPLSVVHPRAYVSPFARIGEAVVVLAGAVINPGAVLEENVCVSTAASIDHDDRLHPSCHVFPGAKMAGSVTVGEFSYVGSGATVIPNVSIGAYSYVGAGATVIEDVPSGIKVAGVPARQIGIQETRPVRLSQRAAFTGA